MTAGPGRGRWVLALLVLALATWAVAAPTWVSAGGTSVLTGSVLVQVPGTRAAPGTVGAALALAAAGAALALAGRLGRWLVLVVVLACGAVVGWSAIAVLADPVPAATQAVAAATGVDHVVGPVRTTVAPWLALVCAAFVVVVGASLGRASGRWAGPSRRHEIPAGAGRPDGAPAGFASQLRVRTASQRVLEGLPDRGDDAPDPGAETGDVERTASADTRTGPSVPAPDERADWDALSRGEDPT